MGSLPTFEGYLSAHTSRVLSKSTTKPKGTFELQDGSLDFVSDDAKRQTDVFKHLRSLNKLPSLRGYGVSKGFIGCLKTSNWTRIRSFVLSTGCMGCIIPFVFETDASHFRHAHVRLCLMLLERCGLLQHATTGFSPCILNVLCGTRKRNCCVNREEFVGLSHVSRSISGIRTREITNDSRRHDVTRKSNLLSTREPVKLLAWLFVRENWL